MMERSYPKRRKYAHPYSPHQHSPSRPRTYNSPVHHSPRRFHSPEHNRGRPRSYNSPEMRNGDNAVLPFYQHSSKFHRTNSKQPYWVDSPNRGLDNANHYLANSQHANNSENCPYSKRQKKEPYWADTVGRKANCTSPKLIHVSEKRPTRQTKEPYWMESFEHYEVESHVKNSQPIDGFAPPPMVHRELPAPAPQYDRSLSYRFPNQDPQYLKKCVLSLKRKCKDTATVTTKTSGSLSSKNAECKEQENTQGSSSISRQSGSNSQDSSQFNSIVGTYDSNSNFIIVSKESSKDTCDTKEKQTLSTSFLDRFENDPEEDDVELISPARGASDENQQSSLNKKPDLVPIDQPSQESSAPSLMPEVENSKDKVIKIRNKESWTSDTKDNNGDTESEAESEVFDDIFFQTISKELENDVHLSEEEASVKEKPSQTKVRAQAGLDEDPSRSEGSISPTFDSTLLRYLDDNIRNRIDNEEPSSLPNNSVGKISDGEKVMVTAQNKEHQDIDRKSENTIELRQDGHNDELKSEGASNKKNYPEVKSKDTMNNDGKLSTTSTGNESSKQCVGGSEKENTTTKVSKNSRLQEHSVDENKDNCGPVSKTSPATVDENDRVTPGAKISEQVENNAETFLEFNSSCTTVEECSNTMVGVGVSSAEISSVQEVPETSETTGNQGIDKELSSETLDCAALVERKSSCEESENSEMKVDGETVVESDKTNVATVHLNVEEGIRLIREQCKSFGAVTKKPTEIEQEKTTNEVGNASEFSVSKQDAQEMTSDTNKSLVKNNSCTEDNNGSFLPLCEKLLVSVGNELQRNEEQTHQHDNISHVENIAGEDVKSDENSLQDVGLSSDSTSPEASEDSSTYHILHTVVVASKMRSESLGASGSSERPASDIVMCNANDLPADSVSIAKAIELVEEDIKDTNICKDHVDCEVATETSKSDDKVSRINSTQDSTSNDKIISDNNTDVGEDLRAEAPSLEKEIPLTETSMEPESKRDEKMDVDSHVITKDSTLRNISVNNLDMARGWEIRRATIEVELKEVSSKKLESLKQTIRCSDTRSFDAKDPVKMLNVTSDNIPHEPGIEMSETSGREGQDSRESTESERVMADGEKNCNVSASEEMSFQSDDLLISKEPNISQTSHTTVPAVGKHSVSNDLVTFNDPVSTCDSKDMEVRDSNLDISSEALSMEDETPPVPPSVPPPVPEELSDGKECSHSRIVNSSATSTANHKTPQTSESQVPESEVNSTSNTDGEASSFQSETPKDGEDVKKTVAVKNNDGYESNEDDHTSTTSDEETVLEQREATVGEHNILEPRDVSTMAKDISVLVENERKEKLISPQKRKVENGRSICNERKDLVVSNERKIDKELEEETAALYKFLESSKNGSIINLLNDTLKEIKRQDSPSPFLQSPSHDSVMTDSEDAYLDTLLSTARRLSDVDSSSRESSDVEIEDSSVLSKEEQGENSDPVMESNVIETVGSQPLTDDLVQTQEHSKTSEREQKMETSVCNNSSPQARQSTCTSTDAQKVSPKLSSKERKQFAENTKDVLRNMNEFSTNNGERCKENKGFSKNCDADGSENDAFVCKNPVLPKVHTKEPPGNNKDVSVNKQDVSKVTIAPRKRGRPSKRAGRVQKAEIRKRRSPRQNKQIPDENLSCRQIPYDRNKSKKFNIHFFCNNSLGRSKDSIELERDMINGETLELDEAQLIDIMEIDDDVDDFHLELEESPKKVCNLQPAPSSGMIVSMKSLDCPLTEQTNDSVGCATTPREEADTISTSEPQGIDNSFSGTASTRKSMTVSCDGNLACRSTMSFDSCKAVSCNTAREKCQSETMSLKACLAESNSSPRDNNIALERRGRRSRFLRMKGSAEVSERKAKTPLRSSSNEGRVDDAIASDKSSLQNAHSQAASILTSVQHSSKEDSQGSGESRRVFSSFDVCSSSSSSSSLSSVCMEDTSSHCSSDKEYASTSEMLEKTERNQVEGESLKITLIGEVHPDTGKWVLGPRKQIKKEVSTGYGLRPSKTRKTRNLSPTPPGPNNAKKRRITITDLRSGTQDPQKLHDLAKRPLEDYIRSVEQVFRSSDKNPKKGLLSIDMNDHISKTVLQNQEGDFLKLGDTDVMYEIVKRAYDESKLKRCRPTPRSLYFAAKQGNALQVLVLAAGCNVNATIPQEKHKTAMHAASAAGHVDVLRLLCMVGGNLSGLDTNLQSPLFDAVENQRTEVVKFLISQGVNLNLKDSQGMTVLHVAAQKSNLEIINLLMETRKLSVNEQDNGGWTALMWTAEGMRRDVARCLLKWGANVNILDTEQNTCLHWAALAGDTEIMNLLLASNVHIDARNMFGATALHISARERKLPNIKTLAKYRPNIDIRNAEGKTAIELVPTNSKCYYQLKRIEMLVSLSECTLKERLVSRDISRGQEKRPIPCVNEVDEDDLPHDFVYVSNNLENQSQGFDRSIASCNCTDGCVNDKHCECAQLSTRKRFWYDETGRINSEIFEEDRPVVYECNMKCRCWANCHQRVVQHGITAGLQLYKTKDKGWAVRTQAFIAKGTFVCEYVGEVLTDSEADRREDDCYLFDLDVKGQSTLFCLDAKFYGNITRFINHSCDPNILPVRVFTDHQVKSCPRIAFFAARDIKPYEEVCSNYGERFWRVKKSEFHCVCNTSKCRYGPS